MGKLNHPLFILSSLLLFYNYPYIALFIAAIAVTRLFIDELTTIVYFYWPRSTNIPSKFEDATNFLDELRIVKFLNENEWLEEDTLVHSQDSNDESLVINNTQKVTQHSRGTNYMIPYNQRKQNPSLKYLIKATTRNIITSIKAKKKKTKYITNKSGDIFCKFYIVYKTKVMKTTITKTCRELIEFDKKVTFYPLTLFCNSLLIIQ